jgi:tRNA threonylcarbamoyladenosine biosynthesis protein TsaE
MIETLCRSVEETHELAARWARAAAKALACGQFESLFFALDGGLGSGKTEWVRGFMAGLGADRLLGVSSPTYAIVNLYEGSPLVRHLDLYRLESAQDLEAIDYRAYFFGAGITLVEWMDKIPKSAPAARVAVHLETLENETRKISVIPHSESLTTWAQAVWT